jgi:hypothetical protein
MWALRESVSGKGNQTAKAARRQRRKHSLMRFLMAQ